MLVSRPIQGSFRYRWHTDAEVGAAVPASAAPTQKAICRVEKVQKFRQSSVLAGDPVSKRQLPFGFPVLAVVGILVMDSADCGFKSRSGL